MSSKLSHKVDSEARGTVDGTSLTDEIGIDDDEIDWRREFTRFDDDDAARLTGMSGTFERIADDLVEDFYQHLTSHAETVDIIESSSKGVEALKKTQTEYLLDLGRGEYGQDYFNRRARIGKIHDMLELAPKSYLGAYTIYYDGIADAITEDIKSEHGASSDDPVGEAVEEAMDRMCSALKLLNLDQQIAMDTYIHSYSEQVEDQLAQRARLQKEVRDDVESPIGELQDESDEIVESTDELAKLADQGADSARDVANEVGNLSATVEEVASTADDVTSRSERADELAQDGRNSAEGAIDTMSAVENAADEVADDVEALHDRLTEIDDVVTIIDDIADKTNLLALNASIEAARAGEAGSGFAVVADEVKSLAEDSQKQASRIDEMVTEIQSDALETVQSLETTNDAIEESTEEVTSVLERLDEIASAVGEATNGIEEVSRAMDEQASSSEEIASMVDELAENSDSLTNEIENISDANRRQRRGIEEVAEAVDRLTS